MKFIKAAILVSILLCSFTAKSECIVQNHIAPDYKTVWLMDGSIIKFDDTTEIQKPFEGLISDDVIQADTVYVKRGELITGEAEFAIYRRGGFKNILQSDRVELLGLLDIKKIQAFIDTPLNWSNSSRFGNILTNSSLELPLYDLVNGSIDATVELSYKTPKGKDINFYAHSDLIAQIPLLKLLRKVGELRPEIEYINLGALGKKSAFATSSFFRFKAFLKAFLKALPFFSKKAFHRKTVKNIGKIIKKKKLYAKDKLQLIFKSTNCYSKIEVITE